LRIVVITINNKSKYKKTFAVCCQNLLDHSTFSFVVKTDEDRDDKFG
jgi:hypothetical protein